jgi:hypothetical protein
MDTVLTRSHGHVFFGVGHEENTMGLTRSIDSLHAGWYVL